eukprot:TRINITY_DN7300_c0_g1_i1.p1 TRINITY_DN7300_c0_g1~~TRINITY_DN7300_c0_g1_i1.p1  ORF type:complete len:298 (+),score=28.71 TRINITY_DN7300_c0_g1_i1:67-960(+)
MADEHVNTFGLFSLPPSIYVGDKFLDKRKETLTRYHGRQFVTSPTKKGKTNDATFSGFITVASGDTFVDPGTWQRKYAVEQKKHRVVEAPFKPSSPGKEAVGVGGVYGTIGAFPAHSDDPVPGSVRRKKGDPLPSLGRNIITSPTKVGGPGFTQVALSRDPEFMHAPYQPERLNEAAARKRDLELRKGGAFRAIAPEREFFDPQVYSLRKDIRLPEPKKLEAFRPAVPFVPGSARLKPAHPEYVSDPYVEPYRKQLALFQRKQPKGPSFKPTQGNKSFPIRSIAFHPREVRPLTSRF